MRATLRHRAGRRAQRGSLALVVALLMGAAMAVLLWVVSTLQARLADGTPQARATYLSGAATALRTWYGQNAARLDADDTPWDGLALLASAGVTRRYGLRVAVSARQGLPCPPAPGECLAYRVIALWLPPVSTPDTSAFDAATGAFAPAAKATWTLVSGQDIERQAVARSRDTMADLQGALQSYFISRQRDDGASTTDTNWFRATPCSNTLAGALPCVDTWTPGAASGLGPLAGIDASRFYDAWGQPIQVSNLQHSSLAPPYAMALKTVTPWGSPLEATVLQPL